MMIKIIYLLKIYKKCHVLLKLKYLESKKDIINVYYYSHVKDKDKESFSKFIILYNSTITKKWMETISFLAMVMIFVSIVSCDSGAT
jgi:hypothetical protein